MPKMIFLDIDGVLLPTTYARYLEQAEQLSRGTAVGHDDYMEHFAPYCVANVQALVRETGAGIVFTSVRRADRAGVAAGHVGHAVRWPARAGGHAHAGHPTLPARRRSKALAGRQSLSAVCDH